MAHNLVPNCELPMNAKIVLLLLEQDCLLKRGIFPSLPSPYMLYAGFAWSYLFLCLIVRSSSLWSGFLKLIIWGAGMSTELEEEIVKGLQLTLCPEGERSGAVSIRLVPSVLFWAPVWSGSIPHSFPKDWGLLTLIFYSLLIKFGDASPTQNKCCKSFFLACFCFIFCLCVCDPWGGSYLVLQHTWNHPPVWNSDSLKAEITLECGVRV